jgi:hypothetical protein
MQRGRTREIAEKLQTKSRRKKKKKKKKKKRRRTGGERGRERK